MKLEGQYKKLGHRYSFSNHNNNDNLMQSVRNYVDKYRREHKETSLIITIYNVMEECDKLARSPNSFRYFCSVATMENYFDMLKNETQIIC